ncbi:unnamed protein product [Acanthosepion pharaonis]|uniref:Reverse transcriptase domain-containing protein n=1 Tax=Acanthosepion pharaonis TaxID=158019 RepID=A0A812CWC5_ACAPH|nr:unnamed protein product [Sepia pharaonis]
MMDEISDVLSDFREHEPYDHLKEAILKRTVRKRRTLFKRFYGTSPEVTRRHPSFSESADLVFVQFDHGENAVHTPDTAKHERYKLSETERASPCAHGQGNRPHLDNDGDEPPAENGEATGAFVGFIAHLAMEPGTVNLPVHTRRHGETNTGAAISVVPYQNDYTAKPTLLKLRAVNGSAIDTYLRTLTLNVGMRRDFTWTFTVANVKIPILGADFLAHYARAVHMNPRTLSDTTTNLRVLGTPTRQSSTGISVATCYGREYLDLLTQFTDITLPLQATASGDHQTQHHIRTRGPPEHSLPRRLAPHKLAYAKEQFDKMLSDVIIRPSDSPYASSLQHLREVFQRLSHYGLKLILDKCVFGAPSVDFLGHHTDANGIAPLPDKIRSIRDFPTPTSIKQLRRFLGMIHPKLCYYSPATDEPAAEKE